MPDRKIELSEYSQALINALKSIQSKKKQVNPYDIIEVSQTASLFGLFYEKIRNAVEYKEEILIRRSAIERILKRRWLLNPTLKDEAENLLRELLWGRYFPLGSLTLEDAKRVQKILDTYVKLIPSIIQGRTQKEKKEFSEFLMSLLTCEIEEELDSEKSLKREIYHYFIFQVIKDKIDLVDEKSNELKNLLVFAGIDKSYFKSDIHYLRYNIFKLLYKRPSKFSPEEQKSFINKFPEIHKYINSILSSLYIDKIARFVKTQRPAFLILQEILQFQDFDKLLTSEEKLKQTVDSLCRKNYEKTKEKVKQTAIRGFIYILVTKMGLALALEYPIAKLIYGEVDYFALGINTFFPPLLMATIVFLTKTPGEENTKRIYNLIVEIIDKSLQYETKKALITKKPRKKSSILIFFFTIFYSLTFVATFSLIFYILDLLGFHLISKIIFIFFISLVSFFGYRVRQIAKEYFLNYKQFFLQPLIDFFFMPVLSIGKVLSQEIGRLNFLVLFLDFIIEAPFKLIVEVIEEWINFVKARKEEIT